MFFATGLFTEARDFTAWWNSTNERLYELIVFNFLRIYAKLIEIRKSILPNALAYETQARYGEKAMASEVFWSRG